MNQSKILLISTDTSTLSTLQTQQFKDLTELTLNLEYISEKYLPIFLRINWGDGVIDIYDNNIFDDYYRNKFYNKKSTIFLEEYSHKYTPCKSSLYKSLTAEVYIDYSNSDKTIFKIPIVLRNNDYFDSIEDVTVVDYCDNSYKLLTSKDNQLIELSPN